MSYFPHLTATPLQLQDNMKCFLVIAGEGSELSAEKVAQVFPDNYEFSQGSVWIVASKTYATAEGVCTALGMLPPDPPHRKIGIVVSLSERSGYVNKSLGDLVSLWENTP